MVNRNLSLPHRFVCATNNATGIDKEINIVPLEETFIGLGNAYPKLAGFRPDAAKLFGDRLCIIDLDAVVVGSLDPLFNRDDDFIIWKDVLAAGQPARFKYNTSFVLMDAGARSKVWQTFSPNGSRRIIAAERRCGSDQAWVSHCLDGEKIWNEKDGVLSWRFQVKGKPLPANAKIIFFHGPQKPWQMPNDPLVKRFWN